MPGSTIDLNSLFEPLDAQLATEAVHTAYAALRAAAKKSAKAVAEEIIGAMNDEGGALGKGTVDQLTDKIFTLLEIDLRRALDASFIAVAGISQKEMTSRRHSILHGALYSTLRNGAPGLSPEISRAIATTAALKAAHEIDTRLYPTTGD